MKYENVPKANNEIAAPNEEIPNRNLRPILSTNIDDTYVPHTCNKPRIIAEIFGSKMAPESMNSWAAYIVITMIPLNILIAANAIPIRRPFNDFFSTKNQLLVGQ